MKPIKLSNIFVMTKNQMVPLNPRLKPLKKIQVKKPGESLPKKIQEINKDSSS